MLKTEIHNRPEIFTIWNNKVQLRMDPYFHLPRFKELYDEIHSCKNVVRLKDIVEFLDYGLMPTQDYAESEKNGVPMIRVTNIIQDGAIDMSNTKYIPFDTPRLNQKRVKEGDILMVQCGSTTGKIAIVPKKYENYTFGSFSFLIRGKQDIINQYYLYTVLMSRLVQEQIKHTWNVVTVRPNTSKPNVENLLIPIPPLETQNEIVAIMQKVYEEKRQKETEAQKLLDSIDDYVLGELGIKIPEVKDEMIFVVGSDEIENKRIDPKAYLEKPKAILKSIRGSKYKTKELSKIVIESIAGEWGSDPLSTENMEGYVLCNVLRNTNFDNQFNLNFDNVAQRLMVKTKFNKIRLKLGDILIEKSGGSPVQPVGRVALIKEDNQEYAFSNFLQCFRINQEECLPEYLFAYLKATYGLGYMEYVQNQTTGIKNLIMEEYLSIPIPFPPLLLQNKIAEGASFRREKAKKLQQEAEELLEQAKRKVEEIIE